MNPVEHERIIEAHKHDDGFRAIKTGDWMNPRYWSHEEIEALHTHRGQLLKHVRSLDCALQRTSNCLAAKKQKLIEALDREELKDKRIAELEEQVAALSLYRVERQKNVPFAASGYYVMRTHSGVTAKITTWKLLSRRFRTYDEADSWMKFEESTEKNPRHRFFIVTVWGEDEAQLITECERDILKRQAEHTRDDQNELRTLREWFKKINDLASGWKRDALNGLFSGPTAFRKCAKDVEALKESNSV